MLASAAARETGDWPGTQQEHSISDDLVGHGKELGFSSERIGKTLEGLRRGMI